MKVKRTHILDERYTDEGTLIDIAVAYVYENGEKEILVMKNEAVADSKEKERDL